MGSILWSMALELAIIAAQMVVMYLSQDAQSLAGLLDFIGHIPSIAVVGTGMAIGAATSWLGWQAGKPVAVGRAGPMATQG